MSRILLIGGHGKVALLAAPLLVEAGHHVNAVIRNPEHEADVAATGATPALVDIEALDDDGFVNLLAGNDVVIWSAGAGGGDLARTYAVDRDAAIRAIDGAMAAGVRRFIMVSYFGADPDHGVDPGDSFFAYAESKAAADARLRESNLEWTIVAPSGLTMDPGTGAIDVHASEGTSVPRADVAAVIAAAVDEPATIGRMIAFNSGDVPIAQALRDL
jgi:uncharacterized protein YbjT (DUF2867 family)